MRLRVGPFVYRLVVVEGFIEHEGESCLGLCDNEAHELRVSSECSEAQQVQVICHEYMEAWLYHFGSDAMDKEAYCDLFGLAMTQFVLDLTRSLRLAGPAVLEALDAAEPGRPSDPAHTAPPAPPDPAPGPPAVAGKRRGPAVHRFRSNGPPAAAGPDADEDPAVASWRREVMRRLARGFDDESERP